jgi:RNA polymerase sigma-70 factor (ECF subfamily)
MNDGPTNPGTNDLQARNDAEVRLIERIVAGETALFSELIHPYLRSLYGSAYAVLRDAADAEEVAQEATLKAFTHLEDLRAGVTFKAWLFQIVLNEARMRLRKYRKHLHETIEDDASEDERGASHELRDQRELPSELLERKETRRAITEALGTLSETYREVFLLRDIQNLSVAETARALRITQDAVKTRLKRARAQMRDKLQLMDSGIAAFRDTLTGMAGRIDYSVAADCPRAEVWKTLTDWQNWPNWERIRGLYGNVYWKSGEPWQVGSRFVFEHRMKIGPLPFTFDANLLVTGVTPLEQITWINHGVGVTVQQSTDLADAEGGGTIISTSAESLGKVFEKAPFPFDPDAILRSLIVNFYDALAEESVRRVNAAEPAASGAHRK